MGEIVPARLHVPRRVLLVGQAPGADGDVRPLTGTMGLRLAELAGLTEVAGTEDVPRDEWIGLWFDRANVLDHYPGRKGKGHAFPPGAAFGAAANMWDRTRDHDRVLYCGKAVFDAFRRVSKLSAGSEYARDVEMLRWHEDRARGQLYAWMPHTSMIVPWWNDPANVRRASDFLRDLHAWTLGAPRSLRAVA